MRSTIGINDIPKTQNEEILYHLLYIGRITSISAIKEYGITRLSARIHNLKDEGWNICSVDKEFTTRHNKKSSYSEYYLNINHDTPLVREPEQST